jgi:SAM-dependent methyltransferase
MPTPAPRPLHDPATWDAAAADYEAMQEPFSRRFADHALRLAGGVGPGERVLDMAAGTGALALAAAAAGARVAAIDFAPAMVARLAARFREGGHDRQGCAAAVMDGAALGFGDGGFDAAFSVFGVMLFADWRRGLAELARVLRPGGRAAVVVWDNPFGAGAGPLLAEAAAALFPGRDPAADAPEGMRCLADPDALRRELAAAGLPDARVFTVAEDWTTPSAAWLVDDLDRVCARAPLWRRLDPRERALVAAAIRERLAAFGDGPVVIPSRAHIAVARRSSLAPSAPRDPG